MLHVIISQAYFSILQGSSDYVKFYGKKTNTARSQGKPGQRYRSHQYYRYLDQCAFHGFYIDTATRKMRFDVVMSFDIDHNEGLRILHDEMAQAYPDYTVQIVPDVDISD